jgi:hypothetical protein
MPDRLARLIGGIIDGHERLGVASKLSLLIG